MEHQTARDILSSLDFSGDDYQITIDSVETKSADKLIKALESTGFETIIVYGTNGIDDALVFIQNDMGSYEYSTPTPSGLTLKVMEALYALNVV